MRIVEEKGGEERREEAKREKIGLRGAERAGVCVVRLGSRPLGGLLSLGPAWPNEGPRKGPDSWGPLIWGPMCF